MPSLTPSDAFSDIVFVNNVAIHAQIGRDSWGREKEQPALITVRVSSSIQKAGDTDDINDTMDYRKIYKAVTSFDKQKLSGPVDLATQVCSVVLAAVGGSRIDALINLPRGLIHSKGVLIQMVMSQETQSCPEIDVESSALLIQELTVPCVIGIGEHERPRKQPVMVSLKLEGGKIEPDSLLLPLEAIFQKFETSSYFTLEAFATEMARFVLLELKTGLSKVTVRASKPAVFAAADGPGVEITRTANFFERELSG